MSKGIIMIAVGHINYYKMAVNLAASIRANSTMPIHLVHDGKFTTLLPNEQRIFTSNSAVPASAIDTKGKVDYIKPKTRLYELSPFDKTLYLDVDMVWLFRPIDQLFAELNDVPLAIMNIGVEEKCFWAEPEAIRAVTNSNEPMFTLYSELMYFEKSDVTKAYFKQVKSNYDKPKLDTNSFAGSHMADELAYIMAGIQTGLHPHQESWMPVYWYLRDKRYRHMQPYQLSKMFYAYSIGGNVTPDYAKNHYNNLVAHYSKQMSIEKPYRVRDKRSYIAERQTY